MKDKLQEKKNIGSLFDRIAGNYDFLNHLFSLNIDKWWRRKAVKRLKGEMTSVLDVAIGTADLTIEILRQGKARNITGIDLSEEMMRIGAEKVKKKGYKDIVNFRYANAQEMPFADNSFDCIVCAFGIRNFANLNDALKEMRRVLKKDGQLLILEFSYPSSRFVATVYDFYFHYIMPLIGRIVSGDKKAYQYFYKSVKTFVWGNEMLDLLAKAGFKNMQYKPLTLGIASIYYG